MAGAQDVVGLAPARATGSRRRAPRVPRVPAGVGVVGASGLAGLAVFAYFAIADRALSPVAADQFAAFYSLSLLLGFGAFLPLESELARTLGRGSASRADDALLLREAAALAAGVALAVTAALAVLALPLLQLLEGSGALLAATAAVVAVSALQFWVRGALLGCGRPTAFAATIAVDSLLRVAVAGALVLALGRPSAAAFSLSLLLPLLVAHLAFLPAVRGGLEGRVRPARSRGWGRPLALARRIAPLFVAALCAQVLLNAPALAVKHVAEPGAAAAFLFAFTLARVPLFMAVPVQGALVPPMAAMVEAGRLDRLARLLLVVAGVVATIAAVGGALAAWVGPEVLSALFPRSGGVPGADLALMVVGVAANVGLLLAAQANLAAGSHTAAAWAWVVALAVAVVVFAAGAAVGTGTSYARVEWAYAAGCGAGWVLAVLLLLRHARRPATHRPGTHRPTRSGEETA